MATHSPTLTVDVDWAEDLTTFAVESVDIQHWVHTVLDHLQVTPPCELSIRMVSLSESQQLNHDYRGKDKPTNVLSFPSEMPDEMVTMLGYLPLGDLVICVDVVAQEATEQAKSPQHHLTHLVVHGVLHLLGYDHETCEADAEEMEALEVEILAKLGVGNPY
ncbi:MAG: rRNA maturation RNase YbeY [Pseudomonadota bacterium]|nr:rRNA maturation RNase YbeY [Pseudomonadota bacterium]